MSHSIEMEFHVIAGHRLMASKGPCHCVHGHNYVFKVVLERAGGPALGSWVPRDASTDVLNEDGMVADFDDVRSRLAPVLAKMDHCFFVQDSDPLYTGRDVFLAKGDEPLGRVASQFKFYAMAAPPTAEHLAYLFYEQSNSYLPAEIRAIKVICVEAPGCEATYSPV